MSDIEKRVSLDSGGLLSFFADNTQTSFINPQSPLAKSSNGGKEIDVRQITLSPESGSRVKVASVD